MKLKWLILTLIGLLGLAENASAQLATPPRHDAKSPTGVSYRNGSFSLEEEDLSVGGGLPAGLSVTRTYNSSVSGVSDPYTSRGWANNFNIYLTISAVAHFPGVDYPSNYQEQCIYNITGGSASTGFFYVSGARTMQQIGCGPYVGTYVPINPSGASLEYILEGGSYHFRYTAADGAVLNFDTTSTPRAANWTFADGTRLDFTYTGAARLKAVFSNRGWAALFESAAKTCIVNIAQTYVTTASSCPADAQTATYGYTQGVDSPAIARLTSVTRGGNTRTYQYGADTDHLTCIKDPGQTVCKLLNTYYRCPDVYPQPLIMRVNDSVTSQTLADGRTITYALSISPGETNFCPYGQDYTEPDTRSFANNSMTVTETGVPGQTIARVANTGHLMWITDPLGRATNYDYQAPNPAYGYSDLNEPGELNNVLQHESNWIDVSDRDARGNIKTRLQHAKQGALPDITSTAAFPENCANRFTCNKPMSVTDPRLGTTEFEYDPMHGGVTLEKAPADTKGIRAAKRTIYVQRAAWLKNASGGYTASPYPVWLVSEVRTCSTSATTGGPGTYACAGGTADELVTTYEYGPNTGTVGNNVLLRGVAVTADVGGVNTTLRTCYTYDRDGRKISETKPLGTTALSTCP